MIVALILAGGVGNRMNIGGLPKQYLMIRERQLLIIAFALFKTILPLIRLLLLQMNSGTNLLMFG